MSLNKQIKKLIDSHTRSIVAQLAEKYQFDAEEALAGLVEGPAKKKASAKSRPANAFMRFSKEQRPTVKQECPDMQPKDILRELGRRWQELTEDEKQPYQEAYEAEKASSEE